MLQIVALYSATEIMTELIKNAIATTGRTVVYLSLNTKSTGLFPPGAALGGGCFPSPTVRLDADILES